MLLAIKGSVCWSPSTAPAPRTVLAVLGERLVGMSECGTCWGEKACLATTSSTAPDSRKTSCLRGQYPTMLASEQVLEALPAIFFLARVFSVIGMVGRPPSTRPHLVKC